ncbi:MAG: ISNCY family transposase, partial [Acetobacteraceae bacterium]|nr:ISNCY family transposase [Acetobacteraceae bacterium]
QLVDGVGDGLLVEARTSDEVRRSLEAIYATLDPVQLLSDIRQAQARLVETADQPVSEESSVAVALRLEQFLASLRTAWEYGEVRPTSRRKEQKKRERRRPDPFVAVTAEVRGWFEAEPCQTGRQLFERLQAAYPGNFPDGQIRTLQRRLKDWRRENSLAMLSVAL